MSDKKSCLVLFTWYCCNCLNLNFFLIFLEYHHCNRHLRLYTSSPPPPPLLPPLRLSQHTHYHHRISYSSLQPHRFFNRPPSPLHSAISPSGSAHSDDLDVDKLSRRPRTSITVCQREFLETEFQKERYPTLAYIDKLSRKVHLQQYVIKVRAFCYYFCFDFCISMK